MAGVHLTRVLPDVEFLSRCRIGERVVILERGQIFHSRKAEAAAEGGKVTIHVAETLKFFAVTPYKVVEIHINSASRTPIPLGGADRMLPKFRASSHDS